MATVQALTGRVVTFAGDPFRDPEADCIAVHDPGAVVIADGIVRAVGDRSVITGNAVVTDHGEHLILPGFVDAHVHYPQVEVVGGYGEELLDWLARYVFPAEQRLADPAHAADLAGFFLDSLVAGGVTTACVFCTSHPGSADAFFTAAAARGLRMAAGKVAMDRNAPAALCDTPRRAHDESAALIARWHGRDRLLYALTPRFAVSSTEAQLEVMGDLARAHPEVLIQSHVSETVREVETVRALFPVDASYSAVYDRFGLLRPGALYGHGIHLGEEELALFHARGAAIAHCPTSNGFLGSGLFDLARARRTDRPVEVALGSDVGAGTSLSPLRTLGEAYAVSALRGAPLSAVCGFWLATLGSARAMGLGDRIGSLAPGSEADVVVLDPAATPHLARRAARADSVEDLLFALMIMGDERAVAATYVAGAPAYVRG